MVPTKGQKAKMAPKCQHQQRVMTPHDMLNIVILSTLSSDSKSLFCNSWDPGNHILAFWNVHLHALMCPLQIEIMWEVSQSNLASYLCWNMHVGKVTSHHASCQEIGRRCTKGECQGRCIMYTSAKCKYSCPLWLWNQQEMSPEVQNRGISGPIMRLWSDQCACKF